MLCFMNCGTYNNFSTFYNKIKQIYICPINVYILNEDNIYVQ